MPRYFKDITIKEMFEYHDHTYEYSDDHRKYTNGRNEREIIENKVKSIGGWTKKLVDLWNKYAPNHDGFQMNWEEMNENISTIK